MTDASAQLPVTASFINPETMHHPAGYTHVVEVTAGRPVYIAGQVASTPPGRWSGQVTLVPRPGRCSTTSRPPFRPLGPVPARDRHQGGQLQPGQAWISAHTAGRSMPRSR